MIAPGESLNFSNGYDIESPSTDFTNNDPLPSDNNAVVTIPIKKTDPDDNTASGTIIIPPDTSIEIDGDWYENNTNDSKSINFNYTFGEESSDLIVKISKNQYAKFGFISLYLNKTFSNVFEEKFNDATWNQETSTINGDYNWFATVPHTTVPYQLTQTSLIIPESHNNWSGGSPVFYHEFMNPISFPVLQFNISSSIQMDAWQQSYIPDALTELLVFRGENGNFIGIILALGIRSGSLASIPQNGAVKTVCGNWRNIECEEFNSTNDYDYISEIKLIYPSGQNPTYLSPSGAANIEYSGDSLDLSPYSSYLGGAITHIIFVGPGGIWDKVSWELMYYGKSIIPQYTWRAGG